MRLVRRADNLTTFTCRLSWNLGASTSSNPQGLSRPVVGLLYPLLLITVPQFPQLISFRLYTVFVSSFFHWPFNLYKNSLHFFLILRSFYSWFFFMPKVKLRPPRTKLDPTSVVMINIKWMPTYLTDGLESKTFRSSELDVFVWEYMKNVLCAEKTRELRQLLALIHSAAAIIIPSVFRRTWRKIWYCFYIRMNHVDVRSESELLNIAQQPHDYIPQN